MLKIAEIRLNKEAIFLPGVDTAAINAGHDAASAALLSTQPSADVVPLIGASLSVAHVTPAYIFFFAEVKFNTA